MLSIKAKVRGDNCSIEVIDRGSGLQGSKGLVYLLGYTTKSNHAGTGLYVCKRIITQYGGQISIFPNREQKGVRISVILPKIFEPRSPQYDEINKI